MADSVEFPVTAPVVMMSLDEARARARERFKDRLLSGKPVGGCECHADDHPAWDVADGGAVSSVVGVRFRDSGRTFFFRATMDGLQVGDWVVVETARGQEAGRVVIAPQQIAHASLTGDLTDVVRRMDSADVERMEQLRADSAKAVRSCAGLARQRRLPMKMISADYRFDGTSLLLNFAIPDRERAPDANTLQHFCNEASNLLGCKVETKQVGPRDEARLLGGLGRCGRTLCCSSWLPVFPEISMNMAKTQDLPLNPNKVSGVCGRLLCCLSYENEQYKQMKAVMPRLGQPLETDHGSGIVISMHLLRELVTLRMDHDGTEVTLPLAELGPIPQAPAPPQRPLQPRQPQPPQLTRQSPVQVEAVVVEIEESEVAEPEAETAADTASEDAPKPARRRRRRRGGGGSKSPHQRS